MANSQRPKIIRIIARLNVGGPAKHVVWLTDGLKETHDTLLVAGTVPEGEGDMSYFADQLHVTPSIIPEMSREISLKDVVTIWKLYRLFRRERPDVVHTHTAKAGTVGRVAGFFYRWFTSGVFIGRPRECKFVHTYHGHIFHSYYGRSKTRLFIAIERTLARLVTDRVVVISEQQAKEICDDFGVGKRDQIKVIPLGLDLDIFNKSEDRRVHFRDELGITPETILVGIVGRLTEIKNHALFLDAVARFKEVRSRDGAPVRFVVVGDGSLRSNLERQSHSRGLKEDVIFAGERKDPESFYPALDIVMLTSRNEGTPLTLIEAMANRRAVIATAVGGVVDLVGDVVQDGEFRICERGLTARAGDVEGLARGLAHLVDDDQLRERIATNGYQFVKKHYPKQRLFEHIRTLYDELLNLEPGMLKAKDMAGSVEVPTTTR